MNGAKCVMQSRCTAAPPPVVECRSMWVLLQTKRPFQNDKRSFDAATLPQNERIDKVKPLWSSLSREERAAYLTVSVKELHQKAVEADAEQAATCVTPVIGARP